MQPAQFLSSSMEAGVAGRHLEAVGEAGHGPPGLGAAVLHLEPGPARGVVVVVAHGEDPGEAGEAGRAVHGAPRGLELRVRGGGHAVVVDVVPGGEDEVAGGRLAPPRHGPRHLQLVATVRHCLGAPVPDSNETYLVLSFQIPDSFCLILKTC